MPVNANALGSKCAFERFNMIMMAFSGISLLSLSKVSMTAAGSRTASFWGQSRLFQYR